MKMSLYNYIDYIDVVTCGKMFTHFHALLNVSIHKWERTILYIHAHFMYAYKSSSVSSNTYSPAYEYALVLARLAMQATNAEYYMYNREGPHIQGPTCLFHISF